MTLFRTSLLFLFLAFLTNNPISFAQTTKDSIPKLNQLQYPTFKSLRAESVYASLLIDGENFISTLSYDYRFLKTRNAWGMQSALGLLHPSTDYSGNLFLILQPNYLVGEKLGIHFAELGGGLGLAILFGPDSSGSSPLVAYRPLFPVFTAAYRLQTISGFLMRIHFSLVPWSTYIPGFNYVFSKRWGGLSLGYVF